MLKSLKDHNQERLAIHKQTQDISPPTGIACPECEHELYLVNRHIVLCSKPPKQEVKCINPNCNYRGYKYA